MYMCGVGGMHMWGGGGGGAVLCSRLIRHVTSRTYIGEWLGKFHEKRICNLQNYQNFSRKSQHPIVTFLKKEESILMP